MTWLLLSACEGERSTPLAPHALLQTAATPPTLSGTSRLLTSSPNDQFDPAISGDIVVFNEVVSATTDVAYVDISTGTATNITNSTNADEMMTDVSGRTIVYTQTDGGDSDVKAFVIGGSTSTVAALAGSSQRNPAISGNIVAWEDTRDGNNEIYAKDLASGGEKRLTNTASAERDPAVSGTRVAYSRIGTTDCQIFVTDFATLVTTQVTNAAGCHRLPDIFGTTVVYEGDRDGNPDVFVFDLVSGTETRLALSGVQRNPNVSADWVAYEDVAPSGARDIRLYHVPAALHFTAVATSSNEFLNDIDGFRVAYTTDAAGHLAIALFEFTPPLTVFRNRGDFEQAAAPLTLVNFDRDPCGSAIAAPSPGVLAANRYQPVGVSFAAGVIFDNAALGGATASPPNIISNTGINTPTPALVDGRFVGSVFAVGIVNVGAEAALRLFDAGGNLVAAAPTDANASASDFLGIVTQAPILRFEFDFKSGLGFGGDDLLFTRLVANPACPPSDPKVALGDLIALVRSLNLPQGAETALLAKLQAALAGLGRGATAATCGQLEAFINQVQAQSGQALTPAQAAQLIAEATRIKVLLGCP